MSQISIDNVTAKRYDGHSSSSRKVTAMTASYYYYLNGVYQYPVSHSHACTLIGVHLPVDDVAGTTYERGEFMFVRGADTPAEGNEDVGVGYDCDGRPIGG